MEYKVKQIWPTHADHISYYKEKDIDNMLLKEVVACQRKYDGERILMHFNFDEVYMTSRRQSKKNNGNFTEVQQNFPCFNDIMLYINGYDILAVRKGMHVPDEYMPLGYTVLDGELYADVNGKNDWSTIVGIIHSLPQRAIELQENENVNVRYGAFDCIFFDGKDMRETRYIDRYNLAIRLIIAIKKLTDQLHIVENEFVSSKEALYECRDEHIARGEEGIVVKSMSRNYYDKGAYLKAKRFETKDLVVYSFDYGNGKYSGTVGALKIGYYDPETDSIIHVTDVNCGKDSDRAEWLEGLTDGTRKLGVVEIKCQEITKTSLRHPVYVRYRPDKDYKMCTKDTIFTQGH